MDSTENHIFEALVALYRRGVEDSFVVIEDPRSKKFVQFGPGRRLVMDVPCVGLTGDEADRASEFFRQLGVDYPREYHAPDKKAGRTHHGASFAHDFGNDARTAARAAVAFFETVYQLPAGLELSIEEN
jgi:hypothetical protein